MKIQIENHRSRLRSRDLKPKISREKLRLVISKKTMDVVVGVLNSVLGRLHFINGRNEAPNFISMRILIRTYLNIYTFSKCKFEYHRKHRRAFLSFSQYDKWNTLTHWSVPPSAVRSLNYLNTTHYRTQHDGWPVSAPGAFAATGPRHPKTASN